MTHLNYLLKRLIFLVALMMVFGDAWGTDYIFGTTASVNGTSGPRTVGLNSPATSDDRLDYWSNYLNNDPTIARCTWHCVDNNGNSAVLNSSTGYYLYVEEDGVKYYMCEASGSDAVEYVGNPSLSSSYTWKVDADGYLYEGSSSTKYYLYFSESDKRWHTSRNSDTYGSTRAKVGSCAWVYVNNSDHGKVVLYGEKANDNPNIVYDVDKEYRVFITDYYLYANESDGYTFKGWSPTRSVSNITSTTMTGYKITPTLSTGSILKYYAMYAPYWYFNAVGVAQPLDYGTVTTSCPARVEGEVAQALGKATATFTATPKAGYAFKGWTRTSGKTEPDKDHNGNLMVSNPINVELTNQVAGTTVTETLYAIFYALVDPESFIVSPTYMELSKDTQKQINLSFVPSSCFQNVTYVSGNSAVATVDASGLVTGKGQGTTTITVTAKKQNGDALPSQTVSVKVMEQLPTPVMTVEPSAEDNFDKALVTITPAAGSPSGMRIYYTTDGTTPTQSSREYTAPFKIANLETAKAVAFCADWYQSEEVSQMYTKRITATPTIDITLSGNTYVVSFSCVDEGVTYYYTLDGSTPTQSSTKYTGPFTPSVPEAQIKVIATHDEWRDSEAASRSYVRASGVAGGVVYLNDYEDHNWTYYSGIGDMTTNPYQYPTRLYSPNPRNVKITYDGNGGAVSISESETKFIYYETLEQGTTAGQYPYTVISSPFSKRPTGKGFGGWKIISGGEYISGKSNGATLALDEAITFVNLPYPSVNCTSASIELQATWVDATIKNATSGTITFTGGTYETNFVVMKSASSSTLTLSSPCTVMAVEPDGSADYRTNKFSGTISPNNDSMSKIEFVNWQYGSSFNAGGRNVTFGRGLTVTSTTISSLNACNSNTANHVFKIESGKYSTFHNYSATPSSVTKQYVVFGCDYDRAKNDNSQLNITSSMYISECRVTSSSDVEVCRVYSKSGQFVSGQSIGSATAAQSYYFGFSGTESYPGYRYLEIQGGVWHNIAGGMSTSHTPTLVAVEYRVKGGTILGSVYGAAQFADAAGIRKFVFTGGTINGWVAGGANGTSDTGGELNGATFVYIGGRCNVTSNNSTTIINHAVGGNVFGAGCGNGAGSDAGIVHNGTNVVFADDAYVERGVYGGGGFGYTTATSNVFVTGGHCGGVNGGVANDGKSIDSNLQGGIFGGACQNKGGAVNVVMTGGTIEGGLFGGSNSTGNVTSVNMTIAGGQIGTKTNLTAKACGGGYGTSTGVTGNVNMTIGVVGATTSPYFYGNCYGGSALGTVTGNVALTINKGAAYCDGNGTGGEIFCGGLGQSGNTSYGNVGGTLTTVINGTDERPGEGKYAFNAVYGGTHYINQSKTPTVTVNGCEVSIKELYGGSKQATLTGTNITVNGGNTIGSLYGGSNMANISGNVTLNVYGGGIDRVFGGNNNSGTIGGTINMSIDQNSSCDMFLGQVYGGGNKAASNAVSINIGCPGYIGQLYGGANEANISGSITLNVHGGKYGAIYGGNNKSGTISGSVTVNVSKNSTCDLEVDTIFGGGNLADLAQSANVVKVNVSGDGTKVGNIYGGGNLAAVYSTTVNVTGGQVSGNIFGGGKGTTGSSKNMILSGGTNVNISGGTLTNVFGGNDAGGTITGTLNTKINKNTSLDITGEVYGGGNEAASASGNLQIDCVDHIGSVYGGAKNADVTGNIALKIKSGRIDNVFGGNNLGGNISGTITIDVQHADCDPIVIGSLYGAGNLADYTAPAATPNFPLINLKTCGKSTVDWSNSGTHCMKIGTVYGGGKGAADNEKGKVIGNPIINANAGEIGTIYGGGNAADVVGNTVVNVIDLATGDNQDIYVTGNVYGGGNQANVTGNTKVQIGPAK